LPRQKTTSMPCIDGQQQEKEKRAAISVAHAMLRIVNQLLTRKEKYVDLG
jgi:hypothetical protein